MVISKSVAYSGCPEPHCPPVLDKFLGEGSVPRPASVVAIEGGDLVRSGARWT